MQMEPYPNMKIHQEGQVKTSLKEKVMNNRNPIVWIMFSCFWIVFFLFIMTGFIPDEAFANPGLIIFMDILFYLFYATHIVMLLTPLVAMALYPEIRIIFLGLGAILWAFASYFWFFVFPLL